MEDLVVCMCVTLRWYAIAIRRISPSDIRCLYFVFYTTWCHSTASTIFLPTMILNVCWRFQRKLNFVFLLFICHILSTYGQGYFPKLVDLAELKPITSTSTCGATTSKYCGSSARQTSLQTCFEETCKFGCCANCGSSKPVPSDLAERSNKVGVTQDGDPRNGTIIRSFRFQGDSHIQPLRVPTIDYVNPGFTISVWIKQKKGNKG